MAERKKVKPITAPAGRVLFSHLTAPDTKFDSAGVFSAKVVYDPKEPAVQAFMAKLDELTDQCFETEKAKLLEDGKANVAKKLSRGDAYEEDENGLIVVNFKMKASGKRKDGTPWSQRPLIIDAALKPVPLTVKIGKGTVLKVSWVPSSYYVASSKTAGLSKNLKGVQILTLVEFGGADAAYLGFEEEEGGFSAADVDTTEVQDDLPTQAADDEDVETEEDGDASDF